MSIMLSMATATFYETRGLVLLSKVEGNNSKA